MNTEQILKNPVIREKLSNTEQVTALETVCSTHSESSTTEAGVTKITKLTKAAKVPTLTKDMSLRDIQ